MKLRYEFENGEIILVEGFDRASLGQDRLIYIKDGETIIVDKPLASVTVINEDGRVMKKLK